MLILAIAFIKGNLMMSLFLLYRLRSGYMIKLANFTSFTLNSI